MTNLSFSHSMRAQSFKGKKSVICYHSNTCWLPVSTRDFTCFLPSFRPCSCDGYVTNTHSTCATHPFIFLSPFLYPWRTERKQSWAESSGCIQGQIKDSWDLTDWHSYCSSLVLNATSFPRIFHRSKLTQKLTQLHTTMNGQGDFWICLWLPRKPDKRDWSNFSGSRSFLKSEEMSVSILSEACQASGKTQHFSLVRSKKYDHTLAHFLGISN